MKKIILILVLLPIVLLIGCGQEKLSHKEAATKYFTARNSAEFNEIKELINDSITIIEGDFIMPYSVDSFYEVFKWDSVFQTKYEIVKIEEVNQQIIASIALSSIRNTFLHNHLMTCQYRLSFKSGKISKIESLDCEGADWEIWQKRVKSLVNWIEINHPELNGFINDMTFDGARNYVNAIKLYKKEMGEL